MINILKFSFILISLSLCKNDSNSSKNDGLIALTFNVNQINLSKNQKEIISNFIRESILSDSTFFDKYYIKLKNLDCKNEIEEDPYIGLKRIRNVIEYLVKKYNFSYNDFLISYSDFSIMSSDCTGVGVAFGIFDKR